MPSDSPDLRDAATQTPSISDAEKLSQAVTYRFSDRGWLVFEEMAKELGLRPSQLTSALRWVRQKSPNYIVESKVSSGVVKVRITQVTLEAKQARQLSVEIVAQLAKLYSNLRHTDRNRDKLAYDVRTIASRIAPFLENREFLIQYRRYKRQLKEPQPQEISMEVSAESSNSLIDPRPVTKSAVPTSESPRLSSFDRRALRRLVLIAMILVVGLLIAVFLTTTFLHAMELLSQYIERINSQLKI
ncbi:MAG: hypothetical protein SFV81_17470 [Pirellulaceae bacterium]|nr:hypothetical protein [Pirellulaceae bacterium]